MRTVSNAMWLLCFAGDTTRASVRKHSGAALAPRRLKHQLALAREWRRRMNSAVPTKQAAARRAQQEAPSPRACSCTTHSLQQARKKAQPTTASLFKWGLHLNTERPAAHSPVGSARTRARLPQQQQQHSPGVPAAASPPARRRASGCACPPGSPRAPAGHTAGAPSGRESSPSGPPRAGSTGSTPAPGQGNRRTGETQLPGAPQALPRGIRVDRQGAAPEICHRRRSEALTTLVACTLHRSHFHDALSTGRATP